MINSKVLKKRASDRSLLVGVLVLLAGSLFVVYGAATYKDFSVYHGQGDWTGEISIDHMEIAGDEYPISNPDYFLKDFDGTPVWSDYYAGNRDPDELMTYKYTNLDGFPGAWPNLENEIGNIIHVDGEDPAGTLGADVPSVYGSMDAGNYYEIFYYKMDLVYKMHADMTGPAAKGYWFLKFEGLDGHKVSNYIGEYGTFHDIYTILRVDLSSLNDTLQVENLSADLAADGSVDVGLYVNEGDADWGRTALSPSQVREMYDRAYQKHENVNVFNRKITQVGFDSAQGFNIVDKDVNGGIWKFKVGFNEISIPGYHYAYNVWLSHYEDMVLFDVEIEIPIQISVTAVYDFLAPQDMGQTNTNTGDPLPDEDNETTTTPELEREGRLFIKDIGLMMGVPEEYALLGGVAVIAVIGGILFKD